MTTPNKTSPDDPTKPGGSPHEDPNGTVTIYVNDGKFQIRRGEHAVAEIKKLASLPQAYELDQKLGGTLTHLDPNGRVHVKGGEAFVGYPGTGASA